MIKSVHSAVSLLNCFAEAKPELSLTELARMTGMNKSTAHHLLSTLVETGLLKKTSGNRYQLGLKMFQFGSLVAARLEVAAVAKPYLQQLREKYNETVHLGALDGLDAMYTDKIDSSRSIRMFSRVGQRMPLYCSGIGKVFLAFNEKLLQQVLQSGLQRRTANTITDPQKLQEELKKIRNQEYALDMEETEEALMSVAAPVRDYTGQVIAAISLAGTPQQMRLHGISLIAKHIKRSGKQISEEMGYIKKVINSSS